MLETFFFQNLWMFPLIGIIGFLLCLFLPRVLKGILGIVLLVFVLYLYMLSESRSDLGIDHRLDVSILTIISMGCALVLPIIGARLGRTHKKST